MRYLCWWDTLSWTIDPSWQVPVMASCAPRAAEGFGRGFVLVLLGSYQNIPSAEQSSHGMREDRGGETVLKREC